MGKKALEFWFDFSCPYAYLGSTQVEALADRVGAELIPKPMLLGGVFRARAVPQHLAVALAPERVAHNDADLRRYAKLFSVPLSPPSVHPRRTVLALRALLASGLEGRALFSLMHPIYRAYWVDDIDISDEAQLASVLDGAGADGRALIEAAKGAGPKRELWTRTDRAIELGIFGAPSFVVDGQMYFGQDRMHEVEIALGGHATAVPPKMLEGPQVYDVELFFDYTSPFSHLAMAQASSLFERYRIRPVALSRVLNAKYGTPELPVMSEAKAQYLARDAERQAELYGVPFRNRTRPRMSARLLAKTMVLAEDSESEALAFAQRIFTAIWVEGRDIDELERDFAPEAVELDRVAEATDSAVNEGLFGVPAVVVQGDDGPLTFFGNDRIELAACAARGVRECM